jgi:hypothetical protein
VSTEPESDPKRLIELIGWPVVFLATVGCATVFALVFWGGQKLDDISGFIGAVATIILAVYVRQVSKDTNGNLSKRDAQIADLTRRLDELHTVRAGEVAQLAQQVPPSASLPPTLAADSHASSNDALNGSTVQVPTLQRT